MYRQRNDPCLLGLDELAREEREISFNPKLFVEEWRVCVDLCHGSPVLGRPERRRNDPKSFVCPGLRRCLAMTDKCFLHHSFQEVQELSAIQAAIRFLPNVLIGIVLNLGTGLLVHRLHANYLVLFTTVLSAGSPLLLAIIDPTWSWWYCAFWAVLLGPLSADGNNSNLSSFATISG